MTLGGSVTASQMAQGSYYGGTKGKKHPNVKVSSGPVIAVEATHWTGNSFA